MRLFTSGLCLISPFPLSQIHMVWCTHSASSHTWTSTTNFTDNGISSNITSYSPNQCCSRESTPPPDRRTAQEPGRCHLLLLLCKLLLHVGAVLRAGGAHAQEGGLSHVGHSSCWHRPQGHATLQTSTAHSSRALLSAPGCFCPL